MAVKPSRAKAAPAGPELSPEQAADEVTRLAPRLRDYTKHAALSLGSYLGANTAVREAHKLKQQFDPIANTYGGECVLITALRVYALFDADHSKVSFQRVHRHLKRPEVRMDLAQRAAGWGGGPSSEYQATEISSRIDLFRETYSGIDWKAHGRLMRLRNIDIAHVTEQKVQDSITYAELQQFMGLACMMIGALSFITSGHHDRSDEWIDGHAEIAYDFWSGHFRLLHLDEGLELPDWHEVRDLL